MEELLKETKTKKCDYCDEYAYFKINKEGIYSYLCKTCGKNEELAKKLING
jgi:DNA-directed RNA polymerase subunit RPC12/RpoP